MKRGIILGFLALVACDTLGQIGFKLTANAVGAIAIEIDWLLKLITTPGFVMIVIAYLGAFVLYMTLIKEIDVGPLFAASHLELVSVSAFSYIWLGERLTLVQLCGCACIVAGVVMLGLSEHRSASADNA
jgi:drug/metabolite transporter (DMT)-like permease